MYLVLLTVGLHVFSSATGMRGSNLCIVSELILSTKQRLQSDTFLYVVGTIIASVGFLHGRKVVILFVIL